MSMMTVRKLVIIAKNGNQNGSKKGHMPNPFDSSQTACRRDIPGHAIHVDAKGMDVCHSCLRRFQLFPAYTMLGNLSPEELSKKGYAEGGDYGWVYADLLEIADGLGFDVTHADTIKLCQQFAFIAVSLNNQPRIGE